MYNYSLLYARIITFKKINLAIEVVVMEGK